MTEEDAKDWLRDRYGAGRFAALAQYVNLLVRETTEQNLVARSTIASVWARHIADSAQLISLGRPSGQWVDVGSGGGLPGLVIAILRDDPITLIEPRRKRADFLTNATSELQLANARVLRATASAHIGSADTISARAVAPIDDLLRWTSAYVSRETTFVLPRGRSAVADMDIARKLWHGSFHVEQSLTDPSAGIVVASGIARR